MAGHTCPIQPLGDLLDKLLQPFFLYDKSYVRDNIDNSEHYSKTNNEERILAIFKVASLYANILTVYGLESKPYWIDKLLDRLHQIFNE